MMHSPQSWYNQKHFLISPQISLAVSVPPHAKQKMSESRNLQGSINDPETSSGFGRWSTNHPRPGGNALPPWCHLSHHPFLWSWPPALTSCLLSHREALDRWVPPSHSEPLHPPLPPCPLILKSFYTTTALLSFVSCLTTSQFFFIIVIII